MSQLKNLQLEDLAIEIQGDVLWIYLNRPMAHNAYSQAMIRSLIKVLEIADRQEQKIKCAVLSGRGKSFCAGGDIKAMKAQEGMFAGDSYELAEHYRRGIQKIAQCFDSLSLNVIGMINGAAIGAGCGLAAMCDLRFASEKAVFATSFASLGLIPGDGGAYFLQKIIGHTKTMEMFLTAKTYSADEALAMGFVSQIFTQEQLEKQTSLFAQKICRFPRASLRLGKRLLLQSRHGDLNSHLDMASAFQGIVQRMPEHQKSLGSMGKN